jgi:DNA-binding NtrC family response regulator
MHSASRILQMRPARVLSTREPATPSSRWPSEGAAAPAGPPAWTAHGPLRAERPGALEGPVQLGKVVTVSPVMHNVLTTVARMARTDVTLTFIGETGTGKDVLAHLLHDQSPRRAEPFVVFDCSAVASNLVESEIFGHERGAFTGAIAAHTGAFERARGGTLFLDEVGELPLDLQPKLLRVLENRCFRRVGGSRERPLDVRVVAATNRDLAALVAARRFREDLYFRLAAAVVSVPPLRERLDDLPFLVAALLVDLGRGEVIVPWQALDALAAHPWPGNVRELKNVLASALAFLDSGVLEAAQLRMAPPAAGASVLDRLSLGGHRLDNLERTAIRQTLLQTGGNKTQAAQVLGIAISTLYEKLKKYNLPEDPGTVGRGSGPACP